jgi:hypothetical protein
VKHVQNSPSQVHSSKEVTFHWSHLECPYDHQTFGKRLEKVRFDFPFCHHHFFPMPSGSPSREDQQMTRPEKMEWRTMTQP